MTEALEILGMEGPHFNIVKTVYDRRIANGMLNGDKL